MILLLFEIRSPYVAKAGLELGISCRSLLGLPPRSAPSSGFKVIFPQRKYFINAPAELKNT
jgi:hypothetical protein